MATPRPLGRTGSNTARVTGRVGLGLAAGRSSGLNPVRRRRPHIPADDPALVPALVPPEDGSALQLVSWTSHISFDDPTEEVRATVTGTFRANVSSTTASARWRIYYMQPPYPAYLSDIQNTFTPLSIAAGQTYVYTHTAVLIGYGSFGRAYYEALGIKVQNVEGSNFYIDTWGAGNLAGFTPETGNGTDNPVITGTSPALRATYWPRRGGLYVPASETQG